MPGSAKTKAKPPGRVSTTLAAIRTKTTIGDRRDNRPVYHLPSDCFEPKVASRDCCVALVAQSEKKQLVRVSWMTQTHGNCGRSSVSTSSMRRFRLLILASAVFSMFVQF